MIQFKKLIFVLSLSLSTYLSFAQTYSNGPISTGATSNSGVAAPTGYTWSECQNITGNTTQTNSSLGFSGFYDSSNSFINTRLADDFVVPTGETWNVTSFDFYCYQTNYTGTVPPIAALRIQLYNGDPSLSSSTAVAGNLSTNVYSASGSGDALMYRILNSAVPTPGVSTNTNNKIWKVRANLSATLTAGTYWVVFQGNSTNNSGFNFVPVTISGSRGLGNAKLKNNGTIFWGNLTDVGNPVTAPDFNQDIAFNVNYTPSLSNESFSKIEAKLFPNPTNDSFILSMTEEVKNNLKSVEIYNFLGQKVKEFSIQESYSIQEMTSGIYFVKLIDKSNSELQNIKIIKS